MPKSANDTPRALTPGTPEYRYLLGSDQVFEAMVHAGAPLTREAYIAETYGSEKPDPWTAEDEADLPTVFQLPED